MAPPRKEYRPSQLLHVCEDEMDVRACCQLFVHELNLPLPSLIQYVIQGLLFGWLAEPRAAAALIR